MITQHRFLARAYAGEADHQPICDLLNLCTAVDALDSAYQTPPQLAQALADPDLDRGHDIRLWEDEAGRLLGYGVTAITCEGGDNITDARLVLSIHPAMRHAGLEDALIAWASARVRSVGLARGQPARLRTGLQESTPTYIAYRRGVLEAHGFHPVRYGFKLALRLDQSLAVPHLPPGYSLHPTQGPADVVEWVAAYNDAFYDHWNHRPTTVAAILHGMADPNYTPEHDLVAVGPDGRFAAFCLCWVVPEDNAQRGHREGAIAILGTRHDHRQIGLGRALLLAGLHRLRADGLATATIAVDAANPTGALRLYELVGFRKILTTVAYVKDLSAPAECDPLIR